MSELKAHIAKVATGKPLSFFPDNDVFWSFPGIKTDFAPNE